MQWTNTQTRAKKNANLRGAAKRRKFKRKKKQQKRYKDRISAKQTVFLEQKFNSIHTTSFCDDRICSGCGLLGAGAVLTIFPFDILCVSEFRRLKKPKLRKMEKLGSLVLRSFDNFVLEIFEYVQKFPSELEIVSKFDFLFEIVQSFNFSSFFLSCKKSLDFQSNLNEFHSQATRFVGFIFVGIHFRCPRLSMIYRLMFRWRGLRVNFLFRSRQSFEVAQFFFDCWKKKIRKINIMSKSFSRKL